MGALIWLKRSHRVTIFREIDYAIKVKAESVQEALMSARQRMISDDHVDVASCLKHMSRIAGSRYQSSPFDALQGCIPDCELIMLRISEFYNLDLDWVFHLVSGDSTKDKVERRVKGFIYRFLPSLDDKQITIHQRLRFYSFLLRLLMLDSNRYLEVMSYCLRGIKERRSTRIYFELYRQLSATNDMLYALNRLGDFLPSVEHEKMVSGFESGVNLSGYKVFLKDLYIAHGVMTRTLLD